MIKTSLEIEALANIKGFIFLPEISNCSIIGFNIFIIFLSILSISSIKKIIFFASLVFISLITSIKASGSFSCLPTLVINFAFNSLANNCIKVVFPIPCRADKNKCPFIPLATFLIIVLPCSFAWS